MPGPWDGDGGSGVCARTGGNIDDPWREWLVVLARSLARSFREVGVGRGEEGDTASMDYILIVLKYLGGGKGIWCKNSRSRERGGENEGRNEDCSVQLPDEAAAKGWFSCSHSDSEREVRRVRQY
jgi:hypothetical protein